MPATITAQKRMTMSEIKAKAKSLGIDPAKMKKTEIIHAIQTREGCTPCFGRSNGQCSNTECCFMPDCLKLRI